MQEKSGSGWSEVPVVMEDARVDQDREHWCSHFGKESNRTERERLGKDRHLQK